MNKTSKYKDVYTTRLFTYFKTNCFQGTAAAAAAKLLQLCPTLCDPMDCSLPRSSIHGIFRQEYWSGMPLPSPFQSSRHP